MPSPSGAPLSLALPQSLTTSKRAASPPKRKRKRQRPSSSAQHTSAAIGDLSRALDEADDVSDAELVAPERGTGGGSEDDDDEGEGEGEGEPSGRRSGGGGKREEKGEVNKGFAQRANKRRGETM